jgi:hypothetical protein
MTEPAAGLAHQTIGHSMAQKTSHARKFLVSDFWAQNNNPHLDKGFEHALQSQPQTYNNRRTEFV